MTFISIEGCEGSGKTTQAKILQEKLISLNHKVILTKEPGGSKFGEKMREILLLDEIQDSMTEFLLLSAARRDHILEIQKALKNGSIVITDRFSDSSLAYQGYAKGLNIEEIEYITKIVTGNIMPKITILLNISLNIMQQRIMNRKGKKTFYDQKGIEFHEKVKNGFLEIAKKYPERIVTVNADLSVQEVSEEIFKIVSKNL